MAQLRSTPHLSDADFLERTLACTNISYVSCLPNTATSTASLISNIGTILPLIVRMHRLEVAARADPSRLLPSFLLATYLERIKPNSFSISLSQQPTVDASKTLSFTLSGSDHVVCDDDALEELAYIGRTLIPSEPDTTTHEWLQLSNDITSAKDTATCHKHLATLDRYLTLRTYLAGYRMGCADVLLWSTIHSNRITLALARRTFVNVARWEAHIEATNDWLITAAGELTSSYFAGRAEKRAAASAAGASFDIDLPHIDGPLITRFPPEPSGYLHIGHAKAAILNDYFARARDGGRLICRFDDTNPSKEKMEFEDAIVHDLKLMEIIPDVTSHSSDYFQQMYEYALQLIRDGKAFADDSELGKGDTDRKNRLPSKRRDMGVEETLSRFGEMKTGSAQGQRWCLRARIAYDSPNGTLRDPVIYRCNLTPHHRTGTTWKIYPTYDFCAPILDSLEGVTLALRTNEYRDRNAQYEWMQDALGLRKVPIWDFSRLNFVRTVLSKRKLTRIVDEGRVWGWDDPRMPTIRGILRRGMTVSCLREFILKQGPSRNVLNLEWGTFWALNKKHMDPVAPRHTAIDIKDAVHCTIVDVDQGSITTKPKYVKNPQLGTKKVMRERQIVLEQIDAKSLSQGEEITLMNYGNVFVRAIIREGDLITDLVFESNLGGDVKRTKKISWLAAVDSNMIAVELVQFDHLLTKDKLEKDDDIETYLAPVTEFKTQAWADCNVVDLSVGSRIQFERKGYYRLDSPGTGQHPKPVFFEIPSKM